jgi:D-alanine-D-alanine ligase
LARLGYIVEEIDVRDREPKWDEKTDLVFICLHGEFGEDGGVQAYCEAQGVPYTGSGVEASGTAYDKAKSKAIFRDRGVPTADSELVGEGGIVSLMPPLILKPVCQGSSVGIEFVFEKGQLQEALARALRCGQPVLAERYIKGREFTVGILGGEALPVVEICPKVGWYSYENKYTPGATEYHCPAKLPEAMAQVIQQVAKDAYQALGCEVYARVDLMIDEQGNVFVLEVNTIPGMTETSLLPKAACMAGLSFESLCQRIVEESWRLRGKPERGCGQ